VLTVIYVSINSKHSRISNLKTVEFQFGVKKTMLMKIVSKSPSLPLVRLQGKLKETE
jgi:hypothetical protein